MTPAVEPPSEKYETSVGKTYKIQLIRTWSLSPTSSFKKKQLAL